MPWKEMGVGEGVSWIPAMRKELGNFPEPAGMPGPWQEPGKHSLKKGMGTIYFKSEASR